ncbi:dirigent protein 5-like [Dorcoceras hygrometricum]|uniref:Dirigent protein 5-like n=1 Tax=Dorcoceras hygrometricum TaxID=472368 RepID=A0A2Z7CQJ7_9LAMI|nr:dirigent protein 5-like [Dorcoceras hygrometricum]
MLMSWLLNFASSISNADVMVAEFYFFNNSATFNSYFAMLNSTSSISNADVMDAMFKDERVVPVYLGVKRVYSACRGFDPAGGAPGVLLRCRLDIGVEVEGRFQKSLKIDSDLVIYRTTLVRTFQVVTICRVDKSEPPPPPPPRAAAVAAVFAGKIVSGQFDEENPFVLISSALIVQPDEGVSDLVVDRIGVNYRNLPRRAGFLKYRLEPGTSASKRRLARERPAAAHPLCALVARHRAQRARCAAPPSAHEHRPLAHLGRRCAARLSHDDARRWATSRDAGRAGDARWSTPCRAAGRASCDGCAQNLRTALHRAMATAAIFVGGGRRPAAAPAMLRRVSDDVVTAGLIPSRVLVRACPGQPVKFSGRISGRTSEDGGDDDQDIERPKICKTGKHCNRIALHIALPLGMDPGPWLATTDRIALAIDHPNPPPGAPPAGLNQTPAVEPGFPENNTTRNKPSPGGTWGQLAHSGR